VLKCKTQKKREKKLKRDAFCNWSELTIDAFVKKNFVINLNENLKQCLPDLFIVLLTDSDNLKLHWYAWLRLIM